MEGRRIRFLSNDYSTPFLSSLFSYLINSLSAMIYIFFYVFSPIFRDFSVGWVESGGGNAGKSLILLIYFIYCYIILNLSGLSPFNVSNDSK